MSQELQERIENLISYYDQHGIEEMIEQRPGFVADDFGHLLKALAKEMD